MARLRTIGFEAGQSSTGTIGESTMEGGPNVATKSTDNPRTGAASLKCDSGAGGLSSNCRFRFNAGECVLGRSYFMRAYIYIVDYPDATCDIMIVTDTQADGFWVRLTPTGTAQLWAGGITGLGMGSIDQQGSDSQVLNKNTWYRLELQTRANADNTDSCELRIDGISVASGTNITATNIVPDFVHVGLSGSPGANKVVYFDDVAINDDQGATQNSWPGAGGIVMLKAISDNQRGSWTAGAGGTTNLWDAVDNTPPIGTATETDLTQIESADTSPNNATDEYRANMTTYADAGIGIEDDITLLHLCVNHGEDIATGTKTGSFGVFSNPNQAVLDTFTFGGDAGALGTWGFNWACKWGTAQLNPTVTLTTSPVMNLRKTDTGSRVASVCFMAIMVEFIDRSPVMQAVRGLCSPLAGDQ